MALPLLFGRVRDGLDDHGCKAGKIQQHSSSIKTCSHPSRPSPTTIQQHFHHPSESKRFFSKAPPKAEHLMKRQRCALSKNCAGEEIETYSYKCSTALCHAESPYRPESFMIDQAPTCKSVSKNFQKGGRDVQGKYDLRKAGADRPFIGIGRWLWTRCLWHESLARQRMWRRQGAAVLRRSARLVNGTT
jgi:hypothetical protein